jgi:hypothetical protein
MFNLDDDVGLEGAIYGVEVVVASTGTVSLKIAVVEVVVIDKAPVEDNATVRLECPGNGIGGFGGSAVVF